MPDGAVVTLDVGVPLRLSGLDVLDRDTAFPGPDQQLATDVFRTVVDPDGAWLAAPFDDPVEASDDPLRWQRKVDLDAQALTVEVIQHVEQPELAAIPQPVSHEVHGPGHVRRVWHSQHVGFVPLQPLARLDPQIQFRCPLFPFGTEPLPSVIRHG